MIERSSLVCVILRAKAPRIVVSCNERLVSKKARGPRYTIVANDTIISLLKPPSRQPTDFLRCQADFSPSFVQPTTYTECMLRELYAVENARLFLQYGFDNAS